MADPLFHDRPCLNTRGAEPLVAVPGDPLAVMVGAAVDTAALAPRVIGVRDFAEPADGVLGVVTGLGHGSSQRVESPEAGHALIPPL